jgi:hypothetical protein
MVKRAAMEVSITPNPCTMKPFLPEGAADRSGKKDPQVDLVSSRQKDQVHGQYIKP